MPVVSVLMVCHRDSPFLRPAVASVLGQTLRDLELVLVDNGAGLDTDGLGEAGRDPRLRLIHFPRNLGIPTAHNAAVAVASGEFIALLDHDDIMLPHRLDRQIALLRAESALGLVSSLAETIDGDGRVVGKEFALVVDEDQRRYSEFAAPVVTPAYTGRRAIFESLPYRQEFSLTADFDFLTRAAEQFSMGAVPEVLLHYRHHDQQATVEHATRIALGRCVVRLLAARRRAGRSEGEDWLGLLTEGAKTIPDESTLMYQYAQRFFAEGLWIQAAYHTRRCFAVRRTLTTLVATARMFGRIWWLAGGKRRLVARMFLLGPVKALQLHAPE